MPAYIASGSQSMSKNEENYVLALKQLKIEYRQQVPIGLYGARGSQMIDIVAYVPPRACAIFIQGSYWHTAKTRVEDELKQSAAEQAGYRVVLVSEEDSATVEAAVAHAKREVL
jgi:G:T-mismatch repair DNA endonuclease (very short patch repair protein)